MRASPVSFALPGVTQARQQRTVVTEACGPALVVEQSSLIALFLDEQLAQLGFQPVSVVSPNACLELLPAARPALAVITIGLEAAAAVSLALALRAAGVPLVLINEGSLALHELPPSLAKAPLLPKPFAPRELQQAVQQAVRGAEHAQVRAGATDP